MPDTQAIRRKLGQARERSAERSALARICARLIQDRLRLHLRSDLAVTLQDCAVRRLAGAMAADGPALVAQIQGPEPRADGLIRADADLVLNTVDLLLSGDPTQPLPAAGTGFSVIDRALSHRVFEIALEALTEALETTAGGRLDCALALSAARGDAAVPAVAQDLDALVVGVEIGFGAGDRRGGLELILPLALLDRLRAATRPLPMAGPDGPADDLWLPHIRRAASLAPLTLHARLGRTKIPLGQLGQLRPGMVIALPGASTDRVDMELLQPGRPAAVLLEASLGVFEGRKVVRIEADPDPDLQRSIATALALIREPDPSAGPTPAQPGAQPVSPAPAEATGAAPAQG